LNAGWQAWVFGSGGMCAYPARLRVGASRAACMHAHVFARALPH